MEHLRRFQLSIPFYRGIWYNINTAHFDRKLLLIIYKFILSNKANTLNITKTNFDCILFSTQLSSSDAVFIWGKVYYF